MSAISLKGRALRCLAAREYSRVELQKKLAPFEEQAGQLAAVLDDLEAKGFIQEHRVVESVLHRYSPKLGAARIRHELQTKGVQTEAIAAAMATLQDTELARARQVWLKKFGPVPATDPPSKAKQIRFLASRGFSSETIRAALKGGDED